MGRCPDLLETFADRHKKKEESRVETKHTSRGVSVSNLILKEMYKETSTVSRRQHDLRSRHEKIFLPYWGLYKLKIEYLKQNILILKGSE